MRKLFGGIILFLVLMVVTGHCPVTTNIVYAYTEATYFIHQDQIGSVVAVTDEFGNVAEQNGFEPYGVQRTEDGGQMTDAGRRMTERGYTGQIKDQNTSLNYYNARYFDSTLSRFISLDSQGANYSYASGNPVSFNDPSGNMVREDSGGGGGGGNPFEGARVDGETGGYQIPAANMAYLNSLNKQNEEFQVGLNKVRVLGNTVLTTSDPDARAVAVLNFVTLGGLESATEANNTYWNYYFANRTGNFFWDLNMGFNRARQPDIYMPIAGFATEAGMTGIGVVKGIAKGIARGAVGMKNYLAPDDIGDKIRGVVDKIRSHEFNRNWMREYSEDLEIMKQKQSVSSATHVGEGWNTTYHYQVSGHNRVSYSNTDASTFWQPEDYWFSSPRIDMPSINEESIVLPIRYGLSYLHYFNPNGGVIEDILINRGNIYNLPNVLFR